MTKQIGITGGIGAGKSVVTKIFKALGVPVYDADSRAKYVMTTDGILISQIKKEFGELSYHPDGRLNNKYLGEAVFSAPKRLQALNSLVHPRVGIDYQHWVKSHDADPYVVKEAALLFEAGSDQGLDAIVVVDAPVSLRIKRVMNRDKWRTEDQIRDIIARQMPDADKLRRADVIIRNDDITLIIPQVLAIHKQFNT